MFVDALRQYREGNSRAFDNIWPELAVLPPELAAYLRSGEAGPLREKKDLERYLFSLESASNTLPWLPRTIRDVGQLRQLLREVPVYIHQLPQTAPRLAGVIEGVFGPAARDERTVSAGRRAEGNRRGIRPRTRP